MKRLNKKGFTLIELLAVITIIAILMFLAIPSVSRIIENSRTDDFVITAKSYANSAKNLWTSDGLYCGSNSQLSSSMVDGDYYILIDTADDTIYPLLESGGLSPWGNRDVKGYVRIQKSDDGKKTKYYVALTDGIHAIYDDVTASIQSDLLVRKDVIQDISSDEDILQSIQTTPFINGHFTICSEESVTWTGTYDPTALVGNAYAIYSDSDKSLTFVRSEEEIKVGDVYEGINVSKVYTNFEETESFDWNTVPWSKYRDKIVSVVVKDNIRPLSIEKWFAHFNNIAYMDLSNLDTSKVNNMMYAFYSSGQYAETLEIIGLDKWNTSNVINMNQMFGNFRNKAAPFELKGIENWNTSKVTDMSEMFYWAGQHATSFKMDLSKWDTSNVTNMERMFSITGNDATVVDIGNLSNWNTSKVTNMSEMFRSFGGNINIVGLDKWDTSNVIDMSEMFSHTVVNGVNLSRWNVSKVTNLHGLFSYCYTGTDFSVDLHGWNTSNVTDMSDMFNQFGMSNATTININLSDWNTSNVTDMSSMFDQAGMYNATIVNIEGLNNWDTSKVTDMSRMFFSLGENATFTLDLSGWNVNNVTSHDYFNNYVTTKVKAPIWKN